MEEARIYAASAKKKRVCTIKYTLRYTLVCVERSAYIRDISEEKARMRNKIYTEVYAGLCGRKRVCKLGFDEAKGMKYLICSAVLLLSDLGFLNWYVSVSDVCLSLKVWNGSSLKV